MCHKSKINPYLAINTDYSTISLGKPHHQPGSAEWTPYATLPTVLTSQYHTPDNKRLFAGLSNLLTYLCRMSGTAGNTQVITTADGSPSLYIPGSDETYHSRHGALTESLHVFIHHGLKEVTSHKQNVRILEIGLGTGLNAALASVYASENNISIEYFATEPYPVNDEVFRQVIEGWNAHSHIRTAIQNIYNSQWEIPADIHEYFRLTKILTPIQRIHPDLNGIDVVFFDAFAPRVQPELWTEEIFSDLYQRLNTGGILVTYCAKGDVRRAMQSAGFLTERLPGPPGKREMLRARRVD